jgi:hypothetical protein
MPIQRLGAAAVACCALLITASTSTAQPTNCIRLSDSLAPQQPAGDPSNRANPWGSGGRTTAARIELPAPHYPACWKTSDCIELSAFGEILNAYMIAWMARVDRDVQIRFDDETGQCWIAAREGPEGAGPITLASGTYRVGIDSPQTREIEMRIRLADEATPYGPLSTGYEILGARYVGPEIADITRLTRLLNTPVEIDPAELTKWLPVAETVTVQGLDAGAHSTARIPGVALERPLANGRTIQSVYALVPGITITESTGNQQQFTSGGARRGENRLTVDGVSADLGVSVGTPGIGEAGSQALPALSGIGSTQTLVPAAAVSEIEIRATTVQSRFAQSSGAQIGIITRAGANVLNASFFVDGRAFPARELAPVGLDKSRWTYYNPTYANTGVDAGGPILRDRAFFYTTAEYQYMNRPYSITVPVPSRRLREASGVSAIEGDVVPFPLPGSWLDYVSRASLLAAFPRPAAPDILDVDTAYHVGDYARYFDVGGLSNRLDTNVGSGHRVFVRHQAGFSKGELYLPRSAPTVNNDERTNTNTLTVGVSSLPSRLLVNELRANISRHRGRIESTSGAEVDNWGNADRWVRLDILPGVGGALVEGESGDSTQRQVQITDTLTYARGRHEWRAGFDASRVIAGSAPATHRYTYSFTGAEQVLAGGVRQILSERVRPAEVQFSAIAAFAEHTFCPSSRLSVNYGVRWSLTPAPRSRNGIEPVLLRYEALPAVERLPRGSRLWQTGAQLAPRVGVSYQLRPSTTLNASWSLIRDELSRPGAAAYGRALPYIQRSIFRPGTFRFIDDQQAELAVPDDSELLAEFYAFSADLAPPRTQQWYVSIEQDLQALGHLRAAYVATSARDLVYWQSATIAGPLAQSVQMYGNHAWSYYRALLVSHTRPLSRGFQVGIQYAWSRATDNDSGNSLEPNVPVYLLSPADNVGRADFDRPHVGRIEASLLVPGTHPIFSSWQLAAAATARSGAAFSVTNRRQLGTTFYALRADYIEGVDQWIDDDSSPTGRRVNPDAFRIPAAARQGTLARNSLRASPLRQIDLSLARTIRLPVYDVSLEVRATAFNLLNTGNYGPPVSDLQRNGFGVPDRSAAEAFGTGTLTEGGLTPNQQQGAARVVQFGVRLMW